MTAQSEFVLCSCGSTLVFAGTVSTTSDTGNHSLGNPLATVHEKTSLRSCFRDISTSRTCSSHQQTARACLLLDHPLDRERGNLEKFDGALRP